MKTIQVSVTSADIENGENCNGYRCPVALALLRAVPPELTPVFATERSIGFGSVSSEFSRGCVTTPPDVAAFISCFDECKPVQPFAFTLEVDDALYV